MTLSLARTWDGSPAPRGFGGEATLAFEDGMLAWSWSIAQQGMPRIPQAGPGFLDGLWEHDVVELFLTSSSPEDPKPAYVELETGPAGHWLALAFRGARRRDAELASLEPEIRTQIHDAGWSGSARFPLAALKPWLGPDRQGAEAQPSWRGLACACLTLGGGERLLLASQQLPGERADFHQPARWLPLTRGRAASPSR